MKRARLLAIVPAMIVALAAPSAQAIREGRQYGCTTGAAVLVNGVTPSAECSFFVSCVPEIGESNPQCGVLVRLDVNGTGQVQGSLTPAPVAAGFPAISCSGVGHCGAQNEIISGPIFPFPYRCAANGVALFVTVTCSVHVFNN